MYVHDIGRVSGLIMTVVQKCYHTAVFSMAQQTGWGISKNSDDWQQMQIHRGIVFLVLIMAKPCFEPCAPGEALVES